MKTTAKNRTAQKFYKLTFIKPTALRRNQAIVWEAMCECGNTTFVVPNSVINGTTTSCGCYAISVRRQSGLQRRKYNPMISTARAVWLATYKECEFELFFQKSQEACHYCARPPHRIWNVMNGGSKSCSSFQKEHGNFIYNGLDRIDSNKTHTPDNIVPCCADCNRAKSDMPLQDFLDLIKKIYDHSCSKL